MKSHDEIETKDLTGIVYRKNRVEDLTVMECQQSMYTFLETVFPDVYGINEGIVAIQTAIDQGIRMAIDSKYLDTHKNINGNRMESLAGICLWHILFTRHNHIAFISSNRMTQFMFVKKIESMFERIPRHILNSHHTSNVKVTKYTFQYDNSLISTFYIGDMQSSKIISRSVMTPIQIIETLKHTDHIAEFYKEHFEHMNVASDINREFDASSSVIVLEHPDRNFDQPKDDYLGKVRQLKLTDIVIDEYETDTNDFYRFTASV